MKVFCELQTSVQMLNIRQEKLIKPVVSPVLEGRSRYLLCHFPADVSYQRITLIGLCKNQPEGPAEFARQYPHRVRITACAGGHRGDIGIDLIAETDFTGIGNAICINAGVRLAA